MKIENLTFETLVAYILPAFLLESVWVPIISPIISVPFQLGTLSWMLYGLVVTVLVGIIINALSTVFMSGLASKERNLVFFGAHGNPSLLKREIVIHYANVPEESHIDLVYALFNKHVCEHVYGRRNYDWYFYMASRNLVVMSPLFLVGLLVRTFITDAIPLFPAIVSMILTAGVSWGLFCFMLTEVRTYYQYYANVALGTMLEETIKVT